MPLQPFEHLQLVLQNQCRGKNFFDEILVPRLNDQEHWNSGARAIQVGHGTLGIFIGVELRSQLSILFFPDSDQFETLTASRYRSSLPYLQRSGPHDVSTIIPVLQKTRVLVSQEDGEKRDGLQSSWKFLLLQPFVDFETLTCGSELDNVWKKLPTLDRCDQVALIDSGSQVEDICPRPVLVRRYPVNWLGPLIDRAVCATLLVKLEGERSRID